MTSQNRATRKTPMLNGSNDFYRKLQKPSPQTRKFVMEEYETVFDIHNISIDSVIDTLTKAREAGATEVFVSRQMVADKPWMVSLFPLISREENEIEKDFREAIEDEQEHLFRQQRYQQYKELKREFTNTLEL